MLLHPLINKRKRIGILSDLYPIHLVAIIMQSSTMGTCPFVWQQNMFLPIGMQMGKLIEWLFHMLMGSQSDNNKCNLVRFYSMGCECFACMQGSFQIRLSLWLNVQNSIWSQLCTLMKNRNIKLISLKMFVVAVGMPVYVSVKYLSIRINIHEMPAV